MGNWVKGYGSVQECFWIPRVDDYVVVPLVGTWSLERGDRLLARFLNLGRYPSSDHYISEIQFTVVRFIDGIDKYILRLDDDCFYGWKISEGTAFIALQ